jgi:serine O-acetyltransferase
LEEDLKGYAKLKSFLSREKNIWVTNPINTQYLIYRYVVNLRWAEYHLNLSVLSGFKGILAIYHTACLIYRYRKLRKISYKTGIQIPPNICGPGLQIWHYGSIIINENTCIGKNLTIYPGVEIGHKFLGGGCPNIGDGCFIGAGAKVFGNIKIGNNVTIASNAVVTHDVPDNTVVGGVPAHVIRYK